MANTIRIKRSASTNVPTPTLAQGELANSEAGSPNGINELYIGITGATQTKLIRNLNGAPAEPTAGLADAVIATGDFLVFEDITDGQGKRELISDIPLSYFNNDNFVTSVVEGAGITVTGTTTATVAVDYLGADNIIEEATDLEGSAIALTDSIIYNDATDGNVKKGLVSDLPYGSGSGDTVNAANEVITGSWTFDGAVTTADFGTGGRVKDGTDVSRPMGFNVLPVYEIDVNDVFDLAHNGFLWHKDSGVAVTFTCDQDTNIPQGATYVVHNDDTENLTIAQGTGVTLAWLEAGAVPATGTFTIEQGGLVTIYKYSDTEFWAWGSKAAPTYVETLTAGVGIINNGTAADPNIALDFSELTDMTASIAGTTQFILQNGATESRKAASEIGLEFFNNSGAEFVSENDTIVVADWNWVLDQDTMSSNSAVHVPTQQSVKAYVDGAVSGALTYKGGYNAATNTPALDTGSPVLVTGDMYTVTAAGSFFGTVDLEVGDVLIAEVDSVDAAALADWTIVQKNLEAADISTPGYVTVGAQTFGGTKSFEDISGNNAGATLDSFVIEGGTF